MTRIGDAIDRCRRAADASEAILVGVSGGKDSLTILDIIVRSEAFERIEAFAMRLVPGLECFEGPVNRACARYGIPVHYVPHWMTTGFLARSTLRFHQNGSAVRALKLRDIEAALTKRTGIGWFAYGERGCDSMARRIYTSACDGVQLDWHRLWPIWDWTTKEVRAYLKHRKIPLPEKHGNRRNSGLTLEGECLSWLKETHPNDYKRVIKYFPFAELQVERFKRGDFDALPGVRAAKGASTAAEKRAVQPESD